MRLFRHRHRTDLFSRALPFFDRYWTPLGTRFQRWVAPRFAQIERQLSRRQKIAAISVFCLLAGSYCMLILVRGLAGPPSSMPTYLNPTAISRPLPLLPRDTLRTAHAMPSPSDSIPIPSSINK